jgi:hypothetical protein
VNTLDLVAITLRGMSFSAELDWSDVTWPRRMPPGWSGGPHCSQVNSDGTASRVRGGRLRTPEFDSPDALADAVAGWRARLRPVLNHRCAARLWVRCPRLVDSPALIADLERVRAYSRTNLPGLWRRVDSLDPITSEVPPAHARAAGAYRAVAQRVRHHLEPAATRPPPHRHGDVRSWARAGVPVDRCGAPRWRSLPPEAVDVRRVPDTGLVQVRCVAAPRDAAELAAAARFAGLWVMGAVTGMDPLWVVNAAGELPRQQPFNARLEQAWAAGHRCDPRRAARR